jgi:peptide/nickel transport system substrate-binding protein
MQRYRASVAVIAISVALLGVPVVETSAQQAGGNLAASGLVGKLEGPELVLDSAKWPKTFKESPDLAELVKAKKLPPVAQRIPQEPLVLKPMNEVGKYGGTCAADS